MQATQQPPVSAGTTTPRRRLRRLDFREQQAKNQRRALSLAVALFAVLGVLGAALGAAWGSWLVGTLAGLTVAGVQWAFARTAGASVIMSAAGAHPVDRATDAQLVNVVEEIAIAAGMPCPDVYLIDDSSLNAFATGFQPEDAAVAITTGLRDKLTRDELQAVLAHEIGHIRNGDTGYMVLIAVAVGAIALLADLGLRSLWHGRHGRSFSGGKRQGPQLLIAAIVMIVLAILAPLVARILQAAVSREREYLADATSVELTRHPRALASALRKLGADPLRLKSANRATHHLYIVNPLHKAQVRSSVFSTHPPLIERVRRVEAMA